MSAPFCVCNGGEAAFGYTADGSRDGPERRRVSADPRYPGPGADFHRTGNVLGDVVGKLVAQRKAQAVRRAFGADQVQTHDFGFFAAIPGRITAIIVSDQTCEDPVQWMNDWDEWVEEGDEEEFSAEGYVAGIAAGDRAVIPERPT